MDCTPPHTNVVLWLHGEDYVVILSKRATYTLLLSAYVLRPHRALTTEREWQAYWKLK